MSSCKHQNLTLLNPEADKLRCRRCHLTIAKNDLPQGYCPECYEATGVRRFEFDEVAESAASKVQYRCEDCGILIEPK